MDNTNIISVLNEHITEFIGKVCDSAERLDPCPDETLKLAVALLQKIIEVSTFKNYKSGL